MTGMRPDTVGTQVGTIPVELSTRFLEHFSEQLYSSPQKAFEELISNGWDAGAEMVDVRVAPDLQAPMATMAVFDNGTSMDEQGLRALWHIAFSPKEGHSVEHGRPVIGKFGIGKLATYLLAQRLTYICKADDGVIRRVTMNYGKVDSQKSADARLINNLELEVFELSELELQYALQAVYGGDEILELINGNRFVDNEGGTMDEGGVDSDEDEFGGAPTDLDRTQSDTWTFVVLSDLKPTGRELRLGILRRMLAAALPFGSEMSIRVNGAKLRSTKLDATLEEEWRIGPDLDLDYIEIDETDPPVGEDGRDGEGRDDPVEESAIADECEADGQGKTRIKLKSGTSPYHYIELPEVGRVTGFLKLFDEKISGGKSEERGSSNGFHVNVLGRVVNQNDPSFGEDNLNHAAWARFRMTVRADGLNEFLTTNREQFKECHGLKVFRAFLRRAFNKARNAHDSDVHAMMPDGGDVLVQSLGVLSLSPLRSIVSEALSTQPPIRGLFDESGIEDRAAKLRSWQDDTAENIRNALGQVRYEKLPDNSFVKFRIRDNAVVVNKEHPFVVEHSGSKAEKELVRTVAMVGLLADVYALDIGIEPRVLDSVRSYRDKLMRFRAMQRRQSGVLIAQLLRETQHDSQNWKRLEAAVWDALRYLDFDVLDLGGSGEPEGIAKAFATPTLAEPTEQDPRPPLYSFSFDAKSSKRSVAATGNISLDAVVEHRDRYNANYALVVAPGFSDGALARRCEKQRVTPMTAGDLGKLLEYTVSFGAIPLTVFREVFEHHDPRKVSTWVEGLAGRMGEGRKLTIDVFVRALEELKGKVPDALAASTIALTCRESLNVVGVRESDVIALVKGLQVIIPDLVGISEGKIVVNASASHVAAAITSQLETLHGDDDDGNG